MSMFLSLLHLTKVVDTYQKFPNKALLMSYIGRFQAIKTDVWLIFSFITCDKTEFLSPMMFSNKYIRASLKKM